MGCGGAPVLGGAGLWFEIQSCSDSEASLSTQTMVCSGAEISPAVACATITCGRGRLRMIAHGGHSTVERCIPFTTGVCRFRLGCVNTECSTNKSTHKKKGVRFEIPRAGSNKQTLQINIKANTEGMLIQFVL